MLSFTFHLAQPLAKLHVLTPLRTDRNRDAKRRRQAQLLLREKGRRKETSLPIENRP